VPAGYEGVASGANSAFRELGGVLGIATLGAVFSSGGGYGSGTAYVAGLLPALWVGVAVLGLGCLAALLLPRRRPGDRAVSVEDVEEPETTASTDRAVLVAAQR
jgi:hypothetical protein